MGMMEIQNKVNELRELARMAEELDTAMEAIKDALKAHMEAQGTEVLNGVDYKISWKAVSSSRLDSSALKKAMPEIAAQFTKTTTTRRFVVA